MRLLDRYLLRELLIPFGYCLCGFALLWTDGPRIMEIPKAMLDEHEARLWTHLMTILIPAITALVFFYVLFMYRLVPRFIAVWGFTAAILMAIAIVLMIYGKVESILLLAPFGLNQLFLSIWLMVKGFKTRNGQGIQG